MNIEDRAAEVFPSLLFWDIHKRGERKATEFL